MIPEQMLEKIRKLCKDLDGLSQESFAKGIKMYAAQKAESQTIKVSGGISKKEYDRLSKVPEYCEATEIIADTLTLLEALDNLEWVYNDLIRKLYHIRPEIPQTPDDEENVYSLEPPFTRSKFLN
ncbi:hypothetical protein LNN31_07170 [Acetobacterium wieringae]|jgi:hypothetical protein|uniref:Uncharacterized protein n=1 Tax=Acetobacterium wieringae TaxID=52694 RepID=A0A5D0WL92_9FIRM|nr:MULTISPECIES: hypothetical protein [Acetobacterium]MEA4807156.1 hypothetical protein [Acetobacterium wieringae]TYC84823.1 hypothetical protein FXB42_10860 [Acetobacterium wieringae]UYO64187.1 hypothetical protein LNN31_07170 [Acetobacterium wieringae]VUZ23485.1 Uncharacterised protein [Acetobacterium wieringae]